MIKRGFCYLFMILLIFTESGCLLSTSFPESMHKTYVSSPSVSLIPAYTSHESISITSNGDFESQGFPGDGTEANPYLIEGYKIGSSVSRDYIHIENTNAHFVIRGCELIGPNSGVRRDGISFDNVIHGEIRDNTFYYFSNGIISYNSQNNTIVNNKMIECPIPMRLYELSNSIVADNYMAHMGGIYLGGGSNVVLRNNKFESCVTPIDLWGCSNSLVEGNFLDYSKNYGVRLTNSSRCTVRENHIEQCLPWGVYLRDTSHSIIINNNIFGSDIGIRLYESNDNSISNNLILKNTEYGVYCASNSWNNLFFLNTIAYNNVSNAYDDGINNQWNTTGIGNYWSDYNGTGFYSIPGAAGSLDYHPQIDVSPVLLILGIAGVAVVSFIALRYVLIRKKAS